MTNHHTAAILHVDDDPIKRYSVTRYLRAAGYDVREAATGAEALELVTEQPDLVLLDVVLPDIHGFDVLRRIRANPATEAIPVLYHSATATEWLDRVEGLDRGADAYLAEPLELEELLATVRAVLRVRQAEKDARAAEQRFRSVWETTADAMVLSDPEGKVLSANPAYFELYGYPPERVVGQSFAIIFPEAQRAWAEWQYRQVFAAESIPPLFQSTVQRADKALREVETRIGFITEHGRRTAMLSTIRDVTERKRAEAAVAQKSAHLQFLFVIAAQLLTTEDPEPFVHAIYQRLADLIGLAGFFHYRTAADQPGRLQLAAYSGVDADTAAEIKQLEYGELVCGTVAQVHSARVIDSVQQSVDPKTAAIRALGITAYACFPLMRPASLYGTISFARRGEDRFNPDELSLMQSVSDLIATAIERQQREAALQQARNAAEQAAERLRHLQAVTAALSGSLTREQVAAIVVDQALPALGADAGNLAVLSPDGSEFEMVATLGLAPERVGPWRRFPAKPGLPMTDALISRQLQLFPNKESLGSRYPEFLGAAVYSGAWALVPLLHNERGLGAMTLMFARPREFSAEDQAMIVALAQQCAQALERAQLYELEQQARSELEQRVEARTVALREEIAKRRRAQQQMEQWREAERARIARELHDELGGALTGLKMGVGHACQMLPGDAGEAQKLLQALSSEIDQTVATVRQIATQIRPAVLDDLGLLAALEWQYEEFVRRTGLQGQFTCDADDLPVAPEAATACFRIFQEALTNIGRHAQATQFTVTVELQAAELELQIRDNGRGMPPDRLAGHGRLGLAGMRERADLISGQLQIESAPGRGTTVTVRIPLAAPDAE